MYNYMTPLSGVSVNPQLARCCCIVSAPLYVFATLFMPTGWHPCSDRPKQLLLCLLLIAVPEYRNICTGLLCREFQVEAHDLQSLLFSFLDELLFVFSTDMLVCKSVRITTLDQEAWTLHAKG